MYNLDLQMFHRPNLDNYSSFCRNCPINLKLDVIDARRRPISILGVEMFHCPCLINYSCFFRNCPINLQHGRIDAWGRTMSILGLLYLTLLIIPVLWKYVVVTLI